MIKLYQFITSPFCEKVRRILNFKEIEFEIVDVPRSQIPGLAHITPSGKLPAIEHDGHAVWDSSNIARYLDRSFPDRPIIPTSPRLAALAHVFEDWADESLYFYEIAVRLSWANNIDRVLPLFASTMPGVPASEIREKLLEGAGNLVRTQGIGRKRREEVVDDVRAHIQALTELLSHDDWLVGESLSIADISVAVQLRALAYAVEIQEILEGNVVLSGWLWKVDELAPA